MSCKKDKIDTGSNILEDEPPFHSYLADSPWPISHRNTYAQASSPLPGPTYNANMMVKDYKPLLPGLITLAISGKYADGKHVIWGNTISTVFKAEDDGNGFNILATFQKPGVG